METKTVLTFRDLIQAQLDGGTVQHYSSTGEGWVDFLGILSIELGRLDDEVSKDIYRIKPTKPSINWEHVHPRYNYLARDINGSVYLYEKEPYKLTKTWTSSTGDICAVRTHSSLKVGDCDWKYSLVKRPEGV